jgi:hypothetical protein
MDDEIKSLRVNLQVPQGGEGEDRYDVHDSAMQEMLDRGVKLPRRPRKESQFTDADGWYVVPNNLTELANDDLGELYTIVQACAAYVSGQLADVRNQYEVAKKQLGFITAHVKLNQTGAQKHKDTMSNVDIRVVEQDAKVTRLSCLLTLMEEARRAAEGDIKMISRIVTIREQDLTANQRADAIQSRKHRNRLIGPPSGRLHPPSLSLRDKELREDKPVSLSKPKIEPIRARPPLRTTRRS